MSSKTTPIATVTMPRCTVCGSSNRGKYSDVRREECGGETPEGEQFTAVTWRRTVCSDCGQHRIDRCLEFAPSGPAAHTLKLSPDISGGETKNPRGGRKSAKSSSE